jgi:hypothetical protein
MSGDPAALKQAVDRLVQRARSFHDLFALNYRDEANRQKLKIGYEDDSPIIEGTLHSLWSRGGRSGSLR